MINGAQEVGFLLLQRQISLSAKRALLSIMVTYVVNKIRNTLKIIIVKVCGALLKLHYATPSIHTGSHLHDHGCFSVCCCNHSLPNLLVL